MKITQNGIQGECSWPLIECCLNDVRLGFFFLNFSWIWFHSIPILNIKNAQWFFSWLKKIWVGGGHPLWVSLKYSRINFDNMVFFLGTLLSCQIVKHLEISFLIMSNNHIHLDSNKHMTLMHWDLGYNLPHWIIQGPFSTWVSCSILSFGYVVSGNLIYSRTSLKAELFCLTL